jgi:hypothetical protein
VNSIKIEDVTGKFSSAFSLMLFNNTENNTKENTVELYVPLSILYIYIYMEYIMMVTQQLILFSVVLCVVEVYNCQQYETHIFFMYGA